MSIIRPKCSITTCTNTNHARTWCTTHYNMWKKYGDPLASRGTELHRLTNTQIYNAWLNIRSRTGNPKDNHYNLYGGRGIKVCGSIKGSLKYFNELMGQRPTPKHSIDRIDTNGHYSCGNCTECSNMSWSFNLRWATMKEQGWNRRKLSRNTSGYIGVISRYKGAWVAQAARQDDDGTRRNDFLGYFKDPEQAALAYDKYVIFFRGEFAVTNIL